MSRKENQPSKFRVSWGEKFADAGFTLIPNLLIDRGSELGITDGEFRAICQIIRYKDLSIPEGEDGEWPFASIRKEAKKSGKSDRAFRGIMTSLEEKNLLDRVEKPRQPSEMDLSGLRLQLISLPEEVPDSVPRPREGIGGQPKREDNEAELEFSTGTQVQEGNSSSVPELSGVPPRNSSSVPPRNSSSPYQTPGTDSDKHTHSSGSETSFSDEDPFPASEPEESENASLPSAEPEDWDPFGDEYTQPGMIPEPPGYQYPTRTPEPEPAKRAANPEPATEPSPSGRTLVSPDSQFPQHQKPLSLLVAEGLTVHQAEKVILTYGPEAISSLIDSIYAYQNPRAAWNMAVKGDWVLANGAPAPKEPEEWKPAHCIDCGGEFYRVREDGQEHICWICRAMRKGEDPATDDKNWKTKYPETARFWEEREKEKSL